MSGRVRGGGGGKPWVAHALERTRYSVVIDQRDLHQRRVLPPVEDLEILSASAPWLRVVIVLQRETLQVREKSQIQLVDGTVAPVRHCKTLQRSASQRTVVQFHLVRLLQPPSG